MHSNSQWNVHSRVIQIPKKEDICYRGSLYTRPSFQQYLGSVSIVCAYKTKKVMNEQAYYDTTVGTLYQ